MTNIKNVAFIDRPVAEVYDFVTTPANWPQWHPSSLAVMGDAAHSLQLGETVTERYRVAGREGEVIWTVSERQAPIRWTIDGRLVDGDGGGVVSYSLTPHGNGTLFERVFSYEPTKAIYHFLDLLFVRRRIKAESTQAVARIKRVLEGGDAASVRATEYYFLDRWAIDAPIDAVWQQIADAEGYSDWWGEVYDSVTPLGDSADSEVGRRHLVHAHGRLPYRLKFISEVVAFEEPTLLALEADGDLTGSGTWRLSPTANGTDVTFEWVVRADKPILQLLSPLLKPLFEWNHRWTMDKGERALQHLLRQRAASANPAAIHSTASL